MPGRNLAQAALCKNLEIDLRGRSRIRVSVSRKVGIMRPLTVLLYGLFCYGCFLGVFLYAIGFIGNFLVPRAIDGEARVSTGLAIAINLGLLSIFAIQHSVMARPTFKRWWTRYIPKPIERSTYVLASNFAMILIFAFWQPFGGMVWNVTEGWGRTALFVLYGAGWGTVLIATFLINHFDLFGLRQTWLHFRGREYTDLKFKATGPYRVVRHPLYVGWIMVFWFTPTMSVPHLFFAVVTTLYILVAIQLEERNLKDALPEYAEYCEDVPMLVPLPARRETRKSA